MFSVELVGLLRWYPRVGRVFIQHVWTGSLSTGFGGRCGAWIFCGAACWLRNISLVSERWAYIGASMGGGGEATLRPARCSQAAGLDVTLEAALKGEERHGVLPGLSVPCVLLRE
jgi:hypothetical protein